MNIADYICEYLAAYHVRYIYGYPGAAILPLLDAINNHPKLEWVLMRHEGSAIYAAAAQAPGEGGDRQGPEAGRGGVKA